MYKQVKIQTPQTPNFILTEELDQPIPIAEFSDQELRAIGDAWTQDLIRKARTRRKTHTIPEESLSDRPLNHERD